MKITQDLIVFDLEATSSTNELGYQENKNIIQIGAVYLKRIENKRYEITDYFNQIIQPTNETISPFIEELTGIMNSDVADKPLFPEAGQSFANWAKRNGNIKSTRLCAWGTYFDVPLLRSHYNRNQIQYPFSGTAYDVKTWACLWLMLSGRRTDKMSVEHLCKVMNITFDGKLHDASVDALLTAKIALRIFSDLDQGFFIDERQRGYSSHFKVEKNY